MARAAVQSNVLAAQKKALDAGNLDLPVGQTQPGQPQAVDTPPPSSAAWLSELQAQQPQEPTQAPAPGQAVPEVQQGFDALEQEAIRHATPDLRTRARQLDQPTKWPRVSSVQSSTFASDPDGGMFTRAKKMMQSVSEGTFGPAASLAKTGGQDVFKANPSSDMSTYGETTYGGDVAAAITEAGGNPLTSAINKLGAVEYRGAGVKYNLAPDLAAAGSLATEKFFTDAAYGKDDGAELTPDPITGEIEQVVDVPGEKARNVPISKTQGNAQLGHRISEEYQKLTGNPLATKKLTNEEATVLGDAFKEMWAMQNPTLVKRYRDADRQVRYQLTEDGANALSRGKTQMDRLFPSKNTRPLKTPQATTLNAKKKLGKVGSTNFDDTIKQAMYNLSTVPNVVNKQRSKILFMTALPVLASVDSTQLNPEVHDSVGAALNGMGRGKMESMLAKQAAAIKAAETDPDVEPYEPAGEMAAIADKLAQEVKAVVDERKGANYLTYSAMTYNGRIQPQQGKFNPTTSKAVRFVTTNAVPARINKGSRLDKNIRQMYAMMLVPGADTKLPAERERMLHAASGKLARWGRLLDAKINQAMPDEVYEQINQAIEQGIPLTDPSFPQVPQLPLDPDADAELIAAIKKKGEDGNAYIDGLIDFAKYSDAMRAGKMHPSFFNAYMDGKTNGIATNGIQMGVPQTAEQTGVLRTSTTDLLDAGDIRNALQDTALNYINDPTQGWKGSVSEYSTELSEVARAVVGVRDLNKHTTMTFGYGKEIMSFKPKIAATIGELAQSNDPKYAGMQASLAVLEEKGISIEDVAGQILEQKYAPALESVMSPEAIRSRGLVRSAAVLAAAMDIPFKINSPTGSEMYMGSDVIDAEQTSHRDYTLKTGEGSVEQAVGSYTQVPSAAAGRNMGEEVVPGEHAYGGIVPGPVQSVDAATVALTAAGNSWGKLKAASDGNPYLHTIYDAFKVDAMGYDVVLEEVNENWIKANEQWSYLEQTRDALKDSLSDWREMMAKRDPNAEIKQSEGSYLKWMLADTERPDGKKDKGNMRKKLNAAGNYAYRTDKVDDAMKRIQHQMNAAGYRDGAPITNRQYKVFVESLVKELDAVNRLTRMADHTNKKKSDLLKRLRAEGFEVRPGKRIALQYYAH